MMILIKQNIPTPTIIVDIINNTFEFILLTVIPGYNKFSSNILFHPNIWKKLIPDTNIK